MTFASIPSAASFSAASRRCLPRGSPVATMVRSFPSLKNDSLPHFELVIWSVVDYRNRETSKPHSILVPACSYAARTAAFASTSSAGLMHNHSRNRYALKGNILVSTDVSPRLQPTGNAARVLRQPLRSECGYATELLTWSRARPAANIANVLDEWYHSGSPPEPARDYPPYFTSAIPQSM